MGQISLSTGYGALEPKLPLNASELTNTIIGNLSNTPLLSLPPGFSYTAFSIVGQPMSDGSLVPADHDGMACFKLSDREIALVRNHELSPGELESFVTPRTAYPVVAPDNKKFSVAAPGGTTTLILDSRTRQLKRHFASLAGTFNNCAGGPTPWGSWISCEETANSSGGGTTGFPLVQHGFNFEVDARSTGLVDPTPLRSMGRFSHEAIAVDPVTGYIYETEDRGDSCFYRFVPRFRPTKPGDLARGEAQGGGELYALRVKGRPTLNTTNNPNLPTATAGGQIGLVKVGEELPVEWVKIDIPVPAVESSTQRLGVRYEAQSKGAAIFYRGEGAWYANDLVYFIATQGGPPATGATIGNGQVWVYNPRRETLTLLIEAAPSGALLDEPDNITVSPFGDLFLCEDGGGVQYVVGVTRAGELYQFAFNNYNDSEFAGACFSPDGQTLFVNIQTPGITYAIWGPWSNRQSPLRRA